MNVSFFLRLAALPAALFALPGCVLTVDEPHRHYDYDYEQPFVPDPFVDGTLTVEWTLDDETHPFVCDDFYADQLELAIYDRFDRLVDVVSSPCTDFATSVDLEEGWYSIDATLIDRSNHAVSTTLRLDDVDIFSGEELRIPIDFPLDSQR